MNAAITVGLSGPAPPTTGTSPPAAAGTGTAEPFAAVLQGAGPPGPVVVHSGGEPPGPEPGSLDLTALIQLLLGGGVGAGDQTTNETDQPDRLAGAGTKQTKDAGELAAEELLVALMAQLGTQVVDPASMPTVVLPAAVAAQQGGVLAATAVDGEVLPVSTDDAGARAGQVKAAGVGQGKLGADAPRVILPSAAADAPRAEAAPVALPEGEQQHALPLKPNAGSDAAASQPVSNALATVVEEPVATDLETVAESVADEAVVEPPAPDVEQPDAPRERGTKVEGVDASTVATHSVTTSSRSTTPLSATDPVAPPANTQVFTGELANTVRHASMLGDQEVRLLLNPPELGHLDIRVVESPEGLRVVLEATSTEAHELIERQLPALRTALEARDLRVQRLQVQQSVDASAADSQSQPGLWHDGQGRGAQDQPGQDATPWSPIASMRSGGTDELVAASVTSGSGSTTRNVAGHGQLNVLA